MLSAALPLHALTLDELSERFQTAELHPLQAKRVFQGLHRQGVRALDEIPELSRYTREFLAGFAPLPTLKLETVLRSEDGTLKLRLLTLEDEAIEAVVIPSANRVTLCVSSQVGCAAGCSFCHTASMGLLRNLEAWEIVDQHRIAQAVWERERSENQPAWITNLVFMGMGEPLHNEAAVVQACRIFGEPLGLGFPPRRLVVSTAGVGPRIRPLWELNIAALAVSLHSTDDAVRDRLIPLNRLCNVAQLREILLALPWRNHESLTVAYVLLEGVNDTEADARGLAAWVQGLPAKVNLLEFNPFPGTAYRRSSTERFQAFRGWLRELGVFNTVRHSRGGDAMAACGQLAAK